MGRADRSALDESVRQHARGLFISREAVDGFLDGATAQDARAVDRLLASELELRGVHRRERLTRRAHFPQVKSFEGYDYSQVVFPDGYGPRDLESLGFLDSAEGFVFHGRTGRGKTHLATAIGVKAVSQGRPVRYHEVAHLVMQLERAQANGGLEAALRDAANADLVILDEFGYVPIDAAGARLLFQVVSDCYETRSLIITTNIEFSKWGAVLADEKLASALLDRVVHHSRLVEFNGTSHRVENALMLEGSGS